MLKNVNSLKLINLKFVLYCFLPYLCIIIKGVIKIPYSLTKKINIMIANIIIQSTDNTGRKIGDFLIDNKTGLQITPTFPNMIDLINYCNNHFPDRESINLRQYKINTIIK